MAERIRVSGFRPPFDLPTHRQRPAHVPLIRPANLVGPVGAVGIVLATLIWGTPHVLLASTSTDYGSYRYYEDCAYAGFDGRMLHLRGGSCPLFRLLKSPGRR